MSLSQYDRVNVPLFNKGEHDRYLCSMCGQYTTLADSMSNEGYNLVCKRCVYKIEHILGLAYGETAQLIQSKGSVVRRLFGDEEITI